MENKKSRAASMSEESGQVLSITSFLGCLGEKMSSPEGVYSVKTYNFSTILEITVAGLEGKATRLMVSRHSDPISGPKMST